MGMDKFGCFMQMYTILPKVLGHPLLMNGLTTLVISMTTNLNVWTGPGKVQKEND